MAVLRGRDITATAVSAMVGAGIFLTPGLLLAQGAEPPVILGLFAAGGVVVLLGAITLTDLARQHPGNGGPYRYLQRLGPRTAFLYTWSRFWVMQCGALAILSLTSMRFLAAALGIRHGYGEAVAALAVLAAVTALNALGLRLGARVQAALTGLKIGTILLLAIGILLTLDQPTFSNQSTAELPGGLGSWALLAIFAFGGWSQVTFLAGETGRDIRKPLAAGIVLVTLIYIAFLTTMFMAGASGDVIAADAAGTFLGDAGGRIVALIIAIAVLGGLHTMTLTGPRLYQATAVDGRWWRPFAQTNRHGAPGKALWFQAEWAGLLVAFSLLASNAFSVLIGSISTAIWLFHALTAAAWFRGGGDVHPIVPALFGLIAAAIVIGGLAQDVPALLDGRLGDVQSVWAVLLVLTGLPWVVGRRSVRASAPRPA